MKKVKMLSLFSGIGAPEQAIKNLGYDLEVVAYAEIDKYASTSYQAIHNEPESKNLVDVSKIFIDKLNIEDVDILFHGSPCQSFSIVGKQEGGDIGSGTKSSLMWETVRIIKDLKPKVVVWENVKGVLWEKHKHNFDLYINKLEEFGYNSTYKIISPTDIGEAQSRNRVFVVSVLNGEFTFPQIETKNKKTLREYLDLEADEKYILQPEKALNFVEKKKSSFKKSMKISDINGEARCLVAKGGKAVITNNYLFSDFSYYNDKSIDLRDIGSIVRKDISIRALKPIEYWRLQGFNDEQFKLAQKSIADKYKKGDLLQADMQLYKQAGNSINVKVLESFIGTLIDSIL